jgi:hypothetical protein
MSELLASKVLFIGFSIAALAATFFVGLGLYLEYERYEDRLKRIGNNLVVGGVVLEALFGLIAFTSATIRESRSDLQIAALGKETETLRLQTASAERDAATAGAKAREAESHLAEANARAKEADARAAEANQKAEAEKLARLKLEDKMAWRHLTAKQRTDLPKLLARLRGTEVVISAQSSDPEASGFSDEIEAVLQQAGVTVTSRRGVILPSGGGTLPLGLNIEVTPDNLSKVRGGILQRAFESQGVSASGRLLPPPAPQNDKPPSGTVEIFVGAKAE